MPVRFVTRDLGYQVLSQRPQYSKFVWDVFKIMLPKFDDMKESFKSFERAYITSKDVKKKVLDGFGRKYAAFPKGDEYMMKAIGLTRNAFHLRKKPTLKKIDLMRLSDIPSNTSPGLVLKRLGFKTKAEAFETAKRMAKKCKHFVGKGVSDPRMRPTWSLASRSHLVLRSQEKVRVVWVCPLDHLLLEGCFALPLIEAYKAKDCPIAWDYGIFGGKYATTALKFNKDEDTAMNIDFSGFDESIPPWLINIAFDIMKSNLEFSYKPKQKIKWMKIFEYIRSCFIKTKFQTADGDIFAKDGGIPSGSWFTQIVGSICNHLVITYANLRAYHAVPEYLKVLGDDSLSIYRDDQKIDVNVKDLIPWFRLLGLEANEKKTLISKDIEEISFLGHYFRLDGPPWRPMSTLLTLLLYPESPDKDWIDAGMRAIGILYDSMSWHKIVWRVCRILIEAAQREIAHYKQNNIDISYEWTTSQERFFKYNLGIDVPTRIELPHEANLFMRGWLGNNAFF